MLLHRYHTYCFRIEMEIKYDDDNDIIFRRCNFYNSSVIKLTVCSWGFAWAPWFKKWTKHFTAYVAVF